LRIAICADDYALTPLISAAILDLARAGRISAISCMTASPLWPELGPLLTVVADTIDVGLHLTLVDEAPLTAMPRLAPRGRLPAIGQLIAKSYLRQVPLDEITRETDAQIFAFENVMGRPPAHIDGHLHAHVLPGIRDVVFSAAERMSPRPWLRSVTDPAAFKRPSAFKAAFLSGLGRRFAREARARGFVTNDGFSGFYDFAAGDYAAAFPAFLKDMGPRHLILCHPGQNEDGAAWSRARTAEYDFLKGSAFATLLGDARIVRLRGADETFAVS
jgi:predicted glycoside hydrolase/deacetylase ChbG (UPF0249 family)